MQYHVSDHALGEMSRRQISVEQVAEVLSSPEQIEQVREGRALYQSRIEMGEPSRVYFFRVFVNIDRYPPEVVTVYRTSKVGKYWRAGP